MKYMTPYTIRYRKPTIPGMQRFGWWELMKLDEESGKYNPVPHDPKLDIGGQYHATDAEQGAPPRKLIDDLNQLITAQRNDYFEKLKAESRLAKMGREESVETLDIENNET